MESLEHMIASEEDPLIRSCYFWASKKPYDDFQKIRMAKAAHFFCKRLEEGEEEGFSAAERAMGLHPHLHFAELLALFSKYQKENLQSQTA